MNFSVKQTQELPVVYCSVDPPRRNEAPKTVSFRCELCSQRERRGREVRHTHGLGGVAPIPGAVVGDRASHCGVGDYLLVIGPEPKSSGTHVAVSAELAELFA
jgi:hypothetical protein